MSSRNDILAAIRRQPAEGGSLPDLQGPWITYADKEQQFCDVLAFVGGRGLVVTPPELEASVRGLPPFADAKQVVCCVPGLDLGNLDLDTVDDPHDLNDVDVAILSGEFAVAENGAVWCTDRGLRQRAIYFICQHLVLVVPRASLVDTMYQAYERIAFTEPGFGAFISGPSKTADIEQSLVIGAHGPRSLTVLLTD